MSDPTAVLWESWVLAHGSAAWERSSLASGTQAPKIRKASLLTHQHAMVGTLGSIHILE